MEFNEIADGVDEAFDLLDDSDNWNTVEAKAGLNRLFQKCKLFLEKAEDVLQVPEGKDDLDRILGVDENGEVVKGFHLEEYEMEVA